MFERSLRTIGPKNSGRNVVNASTQQEASSQPTTFVKWMGPAMFFRSSIVNRERRMCCHTIQ